MNSSRKDGAAEHNDSWQESGDAWRQEGGAWSQKGDAWSRMGGAWDREGGPWSREGESAGSQEGGDASSAGLADVIPIKAPPLRSVETSPQSGQAEPTSPKTKTTSKSAQTFPNASSVVSRVRHSKLDRQAINHINT